MATTAAGLRYPISTDAINIPQDFLNLATDVNTYVVAAVAAQNTTVTAQLAAQDAAVTATLGNLNNQRDLDTAVIMGAF
jgi:hypothetical protein